MPPLTALHERISQDSDWTASYEGAFPEAQRVANAMPLVHVTGVREGRPVEECVAFTSLLLNPPYEIPTSANLLYCGDAARRAEDSFGFSRSVYFFAGRACQEFGDIALAFAPGCQEMHNGRGSATPFDTGGLFLGLLHGDLLADGPSRIAFGREATLRLSEWRARFAEFLAAYFPNIAAYWTDRPSPPDPESMYRHTSNEFRAWTFEVRFYERHPILDHLVGWSAREALMTDLRRLLERAPLDSPLERFFTDHERVTPNGDADFCGRMEAWIRIRLNL